VRAGINIVLKVLEAPIRQIAENSGVEGSFVVGKITWRDHYKGVKPHSATNKAAHAQPDGRINR
jgi:chaperonin GroEL